MPITIQPHISTFTLIHKRYTQQLSILQQDFLPYNTKLHGNTTRCTIYQSTQKMHTIEQDERS